MACNLELSSCVAAAFKTLPTEALQAIDATVTAGMADIDALTASYLLQQIQANIQLLPLQARLAALQATVDKYFGNLQLVPPDLVYQCLDLGQLNLALAGAIDMELADLEQLLFDVGRMNASLLGINAAMSAISDLKDMLECVHEAIQVALTGA